MGDRDGIRRRTLLAAIAAVAGLSGCLDDGETADPTIELTEMGANPEELSVDPGTTVTWRNDIDGPPMLQEETIASARLHEDAEEWEFEATLEEKGDEATHTFDEPGSYTYVGENMGEECMCGAVSVGDVSLDDPLPCSPVAGGGC